MERESQKCCALVPRVRHRSKVEEKHSWPPSGNISGEEKVPTKKMEENNASPPVMSPVRRREKNRK
jgi:hypothetical protein